jgi:hypothetical protein
MRLRIHIKRKEPQVTACLDFLFRFLRYFEHLLLLRQRIVRTRHQLFGERPARLAYSLWVSRSYLSALTPRLQLALARIL